MLPKSLEPHRNRDVRNVARSSVLCQELAQVKYAGRRDWTYHEWNAFLRELDSCDDTVEQWAANLQEIDPCS